MKEFIKKSWKWLVVLAVGAYLFGVSFQFLVWFYPMLQLVAVCGVLGFIISLLTAPKETIELLMRTKKEAKKVTKKAVEEWKGDV